MLLITSSSLKTVMKNRLNGSVEIPDLTSKPEIHDEPVFDGYRKGGCRSGGGEAPKNVMKNDDFYRAD
jgi:hypothetical protein